MQRIIVAGLGPGSWEGLTVRVWEALLQARRVFFRTEQHPIVEILKKQGVAYQSFDFLYEHKANFEEIYTSMVDILLQEARLANSEETFIVFAVPGHPLVAERAVELLLKRASDEALVVELLPAMSGIEAVYTVLKVDPGQGLCILDGLALSDTPPRTDLANLVLQVYKPRIASEVKLNLMEYYADDYRIQVIRGAGIPGEEKVISLPLYKLDHLPWIDHLTSVYLPPVQENAEKEREGNQFSLSRYPLDPLVEVMDALLAPDGCPWDRAQTHHSLRPYLIEETYEVLEALEVGDMPWFAEELGDLLLQIVFHAALARQGEYFDINDVILKITQKMIRRHPHVFGEDKVQTSGEVLVNWEQIKRQESAETGPYLAGIPRALPALLRAQKVQAKATRVGFDWPSIEGVWAKVKEELKELVEALAHSDPEKMQEELGDLLFAVVNLGRFINIDAETALSRTIDKFIRRFNYIEKRGAEEGKDLLQMSLQEMDRWWEEAKQLEL